MDFFGLHFRYVIKTSKVLHYTRHNEINFLLAHNCYSWKRNFCKISPLGEGPGSQLMKIRSSTLTRSCGRWGRRRWMRSARWCATCPANPSGMLSVTIYLPSLQWLLWDMSMLGILTGGGRFCTTETSQERLISRERKKIKLRKILRMSDMSVSIEKVFQILKNCTFQNQNLVMVIKQVCWLVLAGM